jgi:hypothetical protein
LDLYGALRLFKSRDWDAEKATETRLSGEDKDSCPAGLGLVTGDGYILHICPDQDETLVYFHYKSKFLGFLWEQSKTASYAKVPFDKVERLITAFFSSNREAILDDA